jgi:uncharacterized protein YndB with AHSA1/START domain
MVMDDTLGTFDPAGPTISFTRRYRVSGPSLWETVISSVAQSTWFPQRVVGDLLTEGATLEFVSDMSGGPSFFGSVERCDPGRRLSFLWGGDLLTLTVEAISEECRFILDDRLDDIGTAARTAAGWHTCLDRLDAVVEPTRAGSDAGEGWKELFARYVDAFPSEASTKGPPAGAV